MGTVSSDENYSKEDVKPTINRFQYVKTLKVQLDQKVTEGFYEAAYFGDIKTVEDTLAKMKNVTDRVQLLNRALLFATAGYARNTSQYAEEIDLDDEKKAHEVHKTEYIIELLLKQNAHLLYQNDMKEFPNRIAANMEDLYHSKNPGQGTSSDFNHQIEHPMLAADQSPMKRGDKRMPIHYITRYASFDFFCKMFLVASKQSGKKPTELLKRNPYEYGFDSLNINRESNSKDMCTIAVARDSKNYYQKHWNDDRQYRHFEKEEFIHRFLSKENRASAKRSKHLAEFKNAEHQNAVAAAVFKAMVETNEAGGSCDMIFECARSFKFADTPRPIDTQQSVTQAKDCESKSMASSTTTTTRTAPAKTHSQTVVGIVSNLHKTKSSTAPAKVVSTSSKTAITTTRVDTPPNAPGGPR